MPLTDAAVKRAKPGERPFKLYDGKGLFVVVQPNGSKLWRMRYSVEKKERLLSFGPYPEVSLATAREKCLLARSRLRDGEHPAKEAAAADPAAIDPARTFEAVARAWHALQCVRWTEKHADQVIDTLAADIFPVLGPRDIASITPPEVLAAIKGMEKRRAIETAHRVRQRCSAVFQYAIATGIATTDPAAVIARVLEPVVRGRFPAITDLEQARQMLAAVDDQPAHPMTKLAFRMLALTSVRSTELRLMQWAEIEDLDGPEPLWRIPARRMKMKREHLVPLSGKAIDILEVARRLGGGSPLVFPSVRWANRPMSENALGYLLNRAGYAARHVPHGWRSTFSSVMNERYHNDGAIIDLMLAHEKENKVEAAYNRAIHLSRRRELAQAWADLLLEGAAHAAELRDGPRKRPNGVVG